MLEEDIKHLEMEIIEETKKLTKFLFLSKEEIEEIIENHKIIEQINDLIDALKEEKTVQFKDYGKYCIEQCSNLLEKKNFNYMTRIILLNFSEKYREQYTHRFSNKKSLLNNAVILSILAIPVTTLLLISAPITFPYIWHTLSNNHKISEIFAQIKKIIKDIQKQIILEFEKQRDNFISNLSDIEQITEGEISFLKQNNFHDNFKKIENFIKDNSC